VTEEKDRRTEPPGSADAGSSAGAQPERNPKGPQWGSFVRTVLLVAVLLGMVWLAFNVQPPSIEQLRGTLDRLGWGAWIGFVVLYAIVAVTPIPVTVMAVTAGVLFGVIEGSILSVIGVLIGCWGAYWLARGLGKATVERLLGHHAPTVEQHLQHDGFPAVYMLRLMPGLPYWPVNYGSGAFGVSQRDFVVASGLAAIPGQVSLVAIGAFVAEPSVIKGVIVAAAWAIVVVMTVWAYRSWKGKARRPLPGVRFRRA